MSTYQQLDLFVQEEKPKVRERKPLPVLQPTATQAPKKRWPTSQERQAQLANEIIPWLHKWSEEHNYPRVGWVSDASVFRNPGKLTGYGRIPAGKEDWEKALDDPDYVHILRLYEALNKP